eukprot:m.635943 g.635943  ORF g.635943 m.635943 type:complete len:565 (-) comp22589_c0_seq1:1192-2886(-)
MLRTCALLMLVIVNTSVAFYCKQHSGITAFLPEVPVNNDCFNFIASTHVNVNASFKSQSGKNLLSNSTPNCIAAEHVTGHSIDDIQVSQCLNQTQTGFYKCFFDEAAQQWYIATSVASCLYAEEGSVLPAEFGGLPTCICKAIQLNFYCNSTIRQTCTTSSSKKLSHGDLVALSLSGVTLLVVVCVAVLYSLHIKRHRQSAKDDSHERLVLQEFDAAQYKRAAESEHEINRLKKAWIIPQRQLRMHKCVASGGNGDVWKASWGHVPVAVKKLKHPMSAVDATVHEEFDREVRFMESIRHPNLVLFYGAGVGDDNHPFLVMEFMEFGTLCAMLRSDKTLKWEMRLRFASDVADGMLFLHDEVDITHRDLKSANVLIDRYLHAKVADFGESRFLGRYHELAPHTAESALTYAGMHEGAPSAPSRIHQDNSTPSDPELTRGVGTLAWMAPEIIDGGTLYNNAVDVYSFGVLLWELATRQRPWGHITATGIQYRAAVRAAVRIGDRPPKPTSCTPAYCHVMENCWAQQPSSRPTFKQVVQMLEELGTPNKRHADAESHDVSFYDIASE